MCEKRKQLEEQLNQERELLKKERAEKIRYKTELDTLRSNIESRESRPTAIDEYYNIAYSAERKRLNSMFGSLRYGGRPCYPEEKVYVDKVVYQEKEPEEKITPNKNAEEVYYYKQKYKSAKVGRGIFIALTILFLIVAVGAVGLYMGWIPAFF